MYVSDSPRLSSVAVARARPQGPLEHGIVIDNLSGQEVWLPLLPSLRFDWDIDPKSALERFWVGKGLIRPPPKARISMRCTTVTRGPDVQHLRSSRHPTSRAR